MDDFAGLLGLFFQLGVPVLLLFVGLIGGRISQQSHYASLSRREADLADMLVTQLKTAPLAASQQPHPPTLVVAEVVIGTDYLMSFLGTLKGFLGGRQGGFQKMLDRARREATCRLLEAARENGYNAVCNIRYQTADIGGSALTSKVATAPMLVSATAYQATHQTS